MSRVARRFRIPAVIVLLGLAGLVGAAQLGSGPLPIGWRQHDIHRPKPPVVEPVDGGLAAKPPKDAVILFDGSNLDAWKSAGGGSAGWKVGSDFMETVPGTGPIKTKASFGDIQLHVEWAAPNPAVGVSQDRGNSGIFLMGLFEIQVLDSYKAETYADGQAGSIYGEFPPLFNASKPPGEWQTYDIAFRRPRFNAAGTLLEPARVTLFHNGILVQNNEEPLGPTSWLRWLPYKDIGDKGPIALQDHDHPVRYRNIWLRNLPERTAPTEKDLSRSPVIALSTEVLDRYVGQYFVSSKPDALKATIKRDGGHLVITYPFRPQPLVLEPISENAFDMPFTDGRFTFQTNREGKVTGVVSRIGGGERTMKRTEP